MSAHEDPVDYCKAMRQLLEAISTRDRLRDFWQRNMVSLAMLRRSLPDLKTEKDEHYADILTNLYKHQMRVVWEEAKAGEQRARKLAGSSEAGEVHDQGTLRPQNTGQRPSAPEKSPEGPTMEEPRKSNVPYPTNAKAPVVTI
jgi:hypothetical protein